MSKMKKPVHLILILTLILSLIIGATANVKAHWVPNTPGTKWVQMPDTSPGGIALFSVTDLDEFLLTMADDFLCTETGYITDIHVWGSWADDFMPPEPPEFYVCIWSDIPDPDGPGPGYSMPDQMLKEYVFGPEDYEFTLYNDFCEREFLHFPSDGILASKIWQYNFYIPKEDAFLQESGKVYWLSVALKVLDIEDDDYEWGWNISWYGDRWNDDAVLVLWCPGGKGILELRYPDGHDYEGHSMDLAFVITGPAPPPPSEPPPSGDTVGGDVYPVNKMSLLIPWIVLGIVILAGCVYLIRRRVYS